MRRHLMSRGPLCVIVLGLTLVACSSGKPDTPTSSPGRSASQVAGTKGTGTMSDCGAHPNTCNSGRTKAGGTVQFAINQAVTGWNVNAADSANVIFDEVLEGVLPGAYNFAPDFTTYLEPDVFSSATLVGTAPETVVYKIKQDAVWNDGAPIDVSDFEYAWKANSLRYCPKCGSAFSSGYSLIASVSGSDGGKTVTVVFSSPYSEWKSLFNPLYPAHLAEQHGGTTTAAGLAQSYRWFDTTVPTYSGGPYQIQSVVKDTSITEVPNPKWFGAVKPTLDKLIFRVVTSASEQVAALRNDEVQVIFGTPTGDLMKSITALNGMNTFLGPGSVWEHLDLNEKNPLLSDRQLRTAIFTAIDRKAIIDRTVGDVAPGIEPLNSHMYFAGQPGYRDNVTPTGQGTGDIAKAKSILTAAGYTGVGTALKNKAGKPVHIRCGYQAGNSNARRICEVVQANLAAVGIKATPSAVSDPGGALTGGDFDLFEYAWILAPFPVSTAQTLFDAAGGVDFGGNHDPAMESLLDRASKSFDPDEIQRLVNEADVALTNDAYNLPLFQDPLMIAARADIANVRDNPTLGPPYNAGEWGLRAS